MCEFITAVHHMFTNAQIFAEIQRAEETETTGQTVWITHFTNFPTLTRFPVTIIVNEQIRKQSCSSKAGGARWIFLN